MGLGSGVVVGSQVLLEGRMGRALVSGRALAECSAENESGGAGVSRNSTDLSCSN